MKIPRFVTFGANLTLFKYKSDIHVDYLNSPLLGSWLRKIACGPESREALINSLKLSVVRTVLIERRFLSENDNVNLHKKHKLVTHRDVVCSEESDRMQMRFLHPVTVWLSEFA